MRIVFLLSVFSKSSPTILLIPCILIKYTLYTISMNKSNLIEMEEEIGNQVQLFIWRIPKKNHDEMVKLQKRFNDLLIKYGVLRMEIFQLTNTETYDGCTNITTTISANQDEEIWIELQSHKNLKQMNEVITEAMKDEDMSAEGPLLKQFMNLVTPGSGMITGKFTRLRV
jgi:uncharacterized protein YbaA (DUF1428 family)